MAAKEYQLGGRDFQTKAELETYIKAILKTAPLGTPLDGEQFRIVLDLVSLHPDADRKIGSGISRIEVRSNIENGYPSKGFYATRTDGTETDFSYKRCLEVNPYRKKFERACRYAVHEHIECFRFNFFRVAIKPTCPLTGEPLTNANAHVDHAPPCTFERIVDAFCAAYGLDPNEPRLCKQQDNLVVPEFSDAVLRDRFVQFHNGLAQLRVVSQNANTQLVPAAVRQQKAA